MDNYRSYKSCSVEGQMDIGMDHTHILTHMSLIEPHHQCTYVLTYSIVRIIMICNLICGISGSCASKHVMCTHSYQIRNPILFTESFRCFDICEGGLQPELYPKSTVFYATLSLTRGSVLTAKASLLYN